MSVDQVYALADNTYKNLTRDKEPQAVIISGYHLVLRCSCVVVTVCCQ